LRPGELTEQSSLPLNWFVTCINFPLVDNANRTNGIAALTSSVIVPLIDGFLPLKVFTKPITGTGAGLLTNTVSLIANGISYYVQSRRAGV
jgi:hypothetical protein